MLNCRVQGVLKLQFSGFYLLLRVMVNKWTGPDPPAVAQILCLISSTIGSLVGEIRESLLEFEGVEMWRHSLKTTHDNKTKPLTTIEPTSLVIWLSVDVGLYC